MTFTGINRTFSTVNEGQYDTIGAFWDEMTELYGLENIRGFGYGWTEDTIEYAIGLKEGIIEGADFSIELPDEGWIRVTGKTNDLPGIYRKIYEDGPLLYEIETFTEDGDCEILFVR